MNNTSRNYSEPGYTAEDKITRPLMSSMAVLICFMNAIFLYLFIKKPLLRTAPNYFLLSLCISDLSAGALVIPLGITRNELYMASTDKRLFYNVQTAFMCMQDFIAFSTAYHVTVATLDMYVAVKYPLKHFLLTKRIARIITLIIWIIALGLSSIQLRWLTSNDLSNGMKKENHYRWNIFRLVTIFGIPYVIMIYTYIEMFATIFGKKKRLLNGRKFRKQYRKSNIKPVVMFLAMALLFAACWLPWFVGVVVPFDITVSIAFHYIHFITPITNPFLYTLVKQDIKIALKESLYGVAKSSNLKISSRLSYTQPSLRSQEQNTGNKDGETPL